MSGTQTIGSGYVCSIVIDNGAMLSLDAATFEEHSGSYPNTTITVLNGKITATRMLVNNNVELVIEADGEVEVTNDMTNNWNANVTNHGSLTVGGDLTNNGSFLNSGTLVVGGDFVNHYNSEVVFGGTTTINGNLTSNGNMSVPAGSTLSVLGDFHLHWGKTADIDGGLEVGGDVSNNGVIDGDGYMIVDGTTSNNGTIFDNGDGSQDCSNGCGNVGLPVELIEFKAVANSFNEVVLSWRTATEINSDFFTVETSLDGRRFTEVGRITGNGNSKALLAYTWTDLVPLSSLTYYRLNQTDYDGTTEIIGLKAVVPEGFVISFSFYPNPVVSGQPLFLTGVFPENVSIIDQAGKLILNANGSIYRSSTSKARPLFAES